MPVLWAYARDLFQTPGFGDTTDFVQIKQRYYLVHEDINPSGIVPKGPELANWLTPHGRESLGGKPSATGCPRGRPATASRCPQVTARSDPARSSRVSKCAIPDILLRRTRSSQQEDLV
jgi:putative glutathione S-transferase